jgi:thymidylate kinase
MLERWLSDRGKRVVCRWIRPGYTPRLVGAKALLRGLAGKRALPVGATQKRETFMRNPMRRKIWIYLALSDLFVETAIVIRFLSFLGWAVICDRYLADAEIDFRINFPDEHVEAWTIWKLLNRTAVKPGRAFLLQLPFDESVRRSVLKQEPFAESEVNRSRRAGFYETVSNSAGWDLLDALQTVEVLHRSIVARML